MKILPDDMMKFVIVEHIDGEQAVEERVLPKCTRFFIYGGTGLRQIRVHSR